MIKRMFTLGLVLLFQITVWLGTASPVLALSAPQQLFNEAWRIVNQAYLDDSFNHQNWWLVRQKALKQPLPDQAAAYDAIQTMLASLDDPFTRLLKPDQYQSLQTSTSGELSGVGLQITQNPDTGYLEVITPIEGSPAALAGVQPADQILQIDHVLTTNLTLDEAAERMRGPVGTAVQLKIQRSNQEDQNQVLDVDVIRDRISINPVQASLERPSGGPIIGYIRLRQFNANATSEMKRAIARLEAQGAAAYVLDLRNNPGGLLQAGVEIARLWLDSGPIVYTVDRQGVFDNFMAYGPALTHAPLVVLVNRGSASASEILAGALQDTGRAQLVGERTFGKGLIQSLFNLSDGSGLAVTIAKYETPNHTDINKVGITPDLVIPQDFLRMNELVTPADIQYQAALDLLTQPAVIAGAPSS